MKLPIPKPKHVEQMQVISREQFGIELTEEQAFEVLSNLVHFIYLTEYYGPDNPLRPKGNEEPGTATADSGADQANDGIREGEAA